jgi:hypothetical protein
MAARMFWLAILIAFNAPAFGEQSFVSSPLTIEAQKTFEWFDTLEFPDVKGKSFVLAATGGWSQSGNAPPNNGYIYGFLLSENAESFKVLADDLRVQTFHRTTSSTPVHERAFYETVDFAQGAKRYAAFLENSSNDVELSNKLIRGYLGNRGKMFFLAWSCWKNGLTDLAQSFFEKASNIRDPNVESKAQPGLRELLERDLGHETIWLTVMDAENPSISRQELLKRFERITQHYPKSEHAKLAEELAGILKRMVREDGDHRAKSLENSPVEEQVKELIFQLRDQNGFQITQPGVCDIFLDRRGKDSPAHRLVKIGFPAVPQLIKALDDERLTRSIEFGRNFRFSHHILRIGDAALTILENIAQRRFCESSSGCSLSLSTNYLFQTRAHAKSWWKELQKKGEQNTIIDAVTRADSQSYRQARLLISKHPSSAVPAITKGIQNAVKKEQVRVNLVKAMGWVSGDEPIPFLIKEMNQSPFFSARVAAACILFKHGREESVPAMIQEWKSDPQMSEGDRYKLFDLIEFLAWCNKPEAVQTLAENLPKRPPDVRRMVMEVFDENSIMGAFLLEDNEFSVSGIKAMTENVRAEIEKLLVAVLEDTHYEFDARLCDMAGGILAGQWPDKYTFDRSASFDTRDRQRIECINAWRKAHSIQELSLPSR